MKPPFIPHFSPEYAVSSRLPLLIAVYFSTALIANISHADTVQGSYGVSTTGYFEAVSATGAWIATQAEAEDGTSNDQLMTPLRVKQALATVTSSGHAIVSGSLKVTANSSTSIVSLTTAGTTWGYLGSGSSYLPNLTTSAISATAIQISSNTAVTCGTGNAGTLRYNNSNTSLELCTGTGWQMMGVGIPAGTISAFASTTCPTGWSEYTPARGRFLRGIDNGAGNDADGTRAPGATQGDAIRNITGKVLQFTANVSVNEAGGSSGAFYGSGSVQYNGSIAGNGPAVYPLSIFYDASRVVPTAAENRPKNAAVTFCQFNGTSNGWNNPLSGGSTVPGGSTSEIQYNTNGSFDGNAGLTWTNAAQRLSATNISATALTVNGVAITAGGRIGIGTTSPQAPLEVAGTTTARAIAQGSVGLGLISETGWNGNGIIFTNSYETSAITHRSIVQNGGKLHFGRHSSSGPATDMFIAETGRIGIGTNSPRASLDSPRGAVFDQISVGVCAFASCPGDNNVEYPYETIQLPTNTNLRVSFGSYQPFMFGNNGHALKPGGGTWNAISDRRLKDLNGTYTHGLKEIAALDPVRFHYKKNNDLHQPSDREFVGLIAQEVLPHFPEAVRKEKDGYYRLDTTPIHFAMINAVKELKAENDDLKTELRRLRQDFEDYKQRRSHAVEVK
jgi:hypothetical protein